MLATPSQHANPILLHGTNIFSLLSLSSLSLSLSLSLSSPLLPPPSPATKLHKAPNTRRSYDI
ncbi:hypothetical protein PF008_g3195 [Phytophthora fragariae]|uniref:Uncharacterized protein n=1 Tax=Phytophthora fragariae TaxID=53985 RepID=A0A6G0SEY4_9STRA|nr:hypothetical protein PF008_g3195 [Phytophthora fragariae]